MDAITHFVTTPIAVVFAALFGAVWGSFYNVVIARLPEGQSVVRPASRCGQCGAAVRPRDNIPILSYFLLRGRCRACGARFSILYPLVEALSAALAALVFWTFVTADPTEELAVRLGRFAVYFAFTGVLIVLSFIDLATKRLPDVITIPGTFVLFAAAFAAHHVPWTERAIGAAAGYLFFRLIADFYFYVLKREGLGLGDGKLLALIGVVLGWKALPLVVFAGAIIGSAVSIPAIVIANRRSRRDDASLRHAQIPFGPFLAVGALVALFAGDVIATLLLP